MAGGNVCGICSSPARTKIVNEMIAQGCHSDQAIANAIAAPPAAPGPPVRQCRGIGVSMSWLRQNC